MGRGPRSVAGDERTAGFSLSGSLHERQRHSAVFSPLPLLIHLRNVLTISVCRVLTCILTTARITDLRPIPLFFSMQFAEVDVVPISEFSNADVEPCFEQMCGWTGGGTPQGHVVAIKAVLGDVKLVVQCIDIGPEGNAELFKQAFDAFKSKCEPLTEEETAAYTAWFHAKVRHQFSLVDPLGLRCALVGVASFWTH